MENLRILKKTQGCSGCGEVDGILVHHHIEPCTKKYDVSRMYLASLSAFIDEIAKCTVLCENCHKTHHGSGTSLYPGVSLDTPTGKYRAQIGYLGGNIYLGIHATEYDAFCCYESARAWLIGGGV